MPFKPFTILSSKIFAGLAAVLLTGLIVQTVRIEGAFCRDVAPGEKPRCVIQGFRQQLAVVRIDLVAARARTEAEITKHQATKRAYREAQGEAARIEAERLARVGRQQQEITDDVVSDYHRRLDAARADARRLRATTEAGASAAGARDQGAVSGPGTAASGSAEAPGNRRLPLDERLIATEQALQLDALIDWVERQAVVRVE